MVASRGPSSGEFETDAGSDYKDRLLSLLPAEPVAGFLAINGLLAGKVVAPLLDWGVLLILGILTVAYARHSRFPPRQILVVLVAFLVWVFAIGGPFERQLSTAYDPLYGSIALILFTVSAPLLDQQWYNGMPHPINGEEDDNERVGP